MKKRNSIFIFCVAFVLLTGTVFAAPEILPQPSITVSPDIYYPLDEIFYLEGAAKPNSAITVQFSKQGAKPQKFTVKSDARGEWVLAEKISLEAGEWEARARVAESQDNVSDWSNPRVFKVIINGVTIGGVNIKFAAFVLALVLLILIGVVLVFYYTFRVRKLKTALVGKEIREARESVSEGFSEIRRDLLDELKNLESSGRPLSADEIGRKEHLLRELDKLERSMEREIRDVEEKL